MLSLFEMHSPDMLSRIRSTFGLTMAQRTQEMVFVPGNYVFVNVFRSDLDLAAVLQKQNFLYVLDYYVNQI